MGLRRTAALLTANALLVACGSLDGGANAFIAATEGESSRPACPSADFPVFLESFMGNVEVQRNFTATPLRVDSVDANADPEPEVVSKMSSDFAFPVMPGKAEQSEQGLLLSVKQVTDGSIVTLEKPDTDYQVLYHFRKNGCWVLFRKEDRSI